MKSLNVSVQDSVLVAQFNRENPLNPINRELEQSIVEACRLAQDDPTVKAMVLTGGLLRSFSVGDDFKEASAAETPAAIEELIDRITDLCVAILSVTKPIVAGIDGYAIAAGIQIALCCDWRVATPTAKALGFDLKNGIACPMNAYMLEKTLGRAATSDVIFGCEIIPVEWAAKYKLYNEIVEPDRMVEHAISRATILGEYAAIGYRRTKDAVNRAFIQGLRELAPIAKSIHAEGLRSKSAAAHLARVLRT